MGVIGTPIDYLDTGLKLLSYHTNYILCMCMYESKIKFKIKLGNLFVLLNCFKNFRPLILN